MALQNFAGAVAVITGGASGIGLATARALYAKGAHIVLSDINSQGLQQAGQQVRELNPSSTAQVILAPANVTSEEQMQELMREALSASGRIDLVMTSAGIGRGGPIDTFSGEEMQTMLNINFMGTYHAVRAALPAMRQQGTGHFVLMSSVAGKLCPPMLTGYTASKWAVRGFSSALRAELFGTEIGVTTVYPEWVDTPMVRQEGNSLPLMEIIPILTAEQVADAILQAIVEDRRDLTLAPSKDIATAIQLVHDNPDVAERALGKSYYSSKKRSVSQ
jgi:NAD(P)-dependent dehydrogenase (short-subunit alcohol dehydrogenase family)